MKILNKIIHPSIFCPLFGLQAKQSSPDIPFSQQYIPAVLGGTQGILRPGKIYSIVSPVSNTGLLLGSIWTGK